MKRAHYASLHVDDQHWSAVGGLDRQQQPRCIGDDAVARAGMCGTRIRPLDDCRVDLPDLRQRPQAAVFIDRAHSPQKPLTIVLDVGSRVVLRLSQVECPAAVAGRHATRSRAESMHQPRDFSKHFGAQNFDGIRARVRHFLSRLACCRHVSILANAPVAQRLAPLL